MLGTDGQYSQGEKSKGYKFTERYENVSLVRYNYPAFQGEDVYKRQVCTFCRLQGSKAAQPAYPQVLQATGKKSLRQHYL